MNAKLLVIVTLSAFCLGQTSSFLLAQDKVPIAPAEPLKVGWEEIDQRLLFLMVRLANVEASLDAVGSAIAKTTGKRASSQSSVKRAERGNELMDRKAGAPMVWSEFYGRTAERFFYHPVDGNSTYHTRTILFQKPTSQDDRPTEGVPSRQGLPTHQRPPQFDYIYKANRDAQTRAEREVADLGRKIDTLSARRRALEEEQSDLWCQIAFRAASRHDLARKPLLRFEPAVAGVTTVDQQHAEALRAAATFLGVTLSIIDEAQKDQPRAFANIKTVVGDGRRALDDCWVRQVSIANELSVTGGSANQFTALAKRLEDVANNLSDSYQVANEGDLAKDQQRKDTFRALLQGSLVDYAEIVLALNEMAVEMASEWKATPDVKKPLVVNVSFAMPASVPNRRTTVGSNRADGNDANPLLGEWVAIAEESRGVAKTGVQMRILDKHLVFRQDSVSLTYTTETRRTFRGRYDIPSGGAAGAVDLHLPAFTRAGKEALVKAIYEVDGNTLTICWTTTIIDEPEKPRPTSFQTSSTDGAVSTILKRVSQ